MSLLVGVVAGAQASEVPVGEYEKTEYGTGTLTVKDQGGTRTFSIDSVGANSHLCLIDGTLDGTQSVVREEGRKETCVVNFAVKGTEIEVSNHPSSLTKEGWDVCREYCGARAGFDGTYRLPPSACKPVERDRRRAEFMRQYKDKRYAVAAESLQALQDECRFFFDWITRDEIRNDLAITQYHLGKYGQCLKTLEPTRGFNYPNRDALWEGTPGTADFDNYLPVAQATWHNLALCRAKSSR